MIVPFALVGAVKPLRVSREQVRSFLCATYAVLGFHNLYPDRTIKVFVRDLDRANTGRQGTYSPSRRVIQVDKNLSPEAMLTTCLHEAIHSVVEFGEGTDEKCTSTLVAKLKPDVAKLAQMLLDNTYQRAAYIAHTKLAYRAKNGDFYDSRQHRAVGVRPKYLNKRKRRSA